MVQDLYVSFGEFYSHANECTAAVGHSVYEYSEAIYMYYGLQVFGYLIIIDIRNLPWFNKSKLYDSDNLHNLNYSNLDSDLESNSNPIKLN